MTAAIGLAMGLGGCSALRQNFARESALSRELDAYVIQKPLDDVWEDVSKVKGEHGTLLWDGTSFTWEEVRNGQKHTAKEKDERTESNGDRVVELTWFECHGESLPEGCRVKYFEVTQRTTYRGGNSLGTDEIRNRRTDLEIELIRMYDPAAAERIEAAGDQAAKDAA